MTDSTIALIEAKAEELCRERGHNLRIAWTFHDDAAKLIITTLLERCEKAEAETERLTKLNVELCDNYNTQLTQLSQARDHAEEAEARLNDANQEVRLAYEKLEAADTKVKELEDERGAFDELKATYREELQSALTERDTAIRERDELRKRVAEVQKWAANEIDMHIVRQVTDLQTINGLKAERDELQGALRVLSEVHLRDDEVSGFVIMMGATPEWTPHHVYVEAWETVWKSLRRARASSDSNG